MRWEGKGCAGGTAAKSVALNEKTSCRAVFRPQIYAGPLPCLSGGIAGPGQGLTLADDSTLTANLEQISLGWDQPSVSSANMILTKSHYTAGDWERFFEKFFNQTRHVYTNDLADYLSYPLYYWFDSTVHLKLQTGLICPLAKKVSQLIAAHPMDLGPTLDADSGIRADLFNAHRTFDGIGVRGEIDLSKRDVIYGMYRDLIAHYPHYFHASSTIDTTTQPYVAALRAQMWMSFRDIRPLTSLTQTDIAQVLGLTGRHLDIWNATLTLIHDNNGFDAAQKDVLLNYLTSVPASLLDLGNITQNDLLGNAGSRLRWPVARSAVNIFNLPVGIFPENSFPADISPRMIDTFSVVLAHEANHVVDALYIEKTPALKARRAQLVTQAGMVDLQYLRSMIGGEFFQQYPQEFFASISNQWFTDSEHTLALGMQRFDAGYQEPVNQALFIADVYSNGGMSTLFYRIDTSGQITRQTVPVGRDAAGRLNQMTYGGKQYTFSLDTNGNVQSYQVVSVP